MFCALLTSRYQVSVYRTNGPLVFYLYLTFIKSIYQLHSLMVSKQAALDSVPAVLLAHPSRRLIGELIVYQWSVIRRPSSVRRRRPQCSNIFFSETAWPIKAKFYVETHWVGGTILFAASGSHDQDGRLAHIWLKTLQKSSPEPACRFSRNLVCSIRDSSYHSLFK